MSRCRRHNLEPCANCIETFWCEPINLAAEDLRRFTFSSSIGGRYKMVDCPASSYGHDATVKIADVPYTKDDNGQRMDDLDHADPRWPQKCDKCSYVFESDDQWQHGFDRYYEGGGHRFKLNFGDWPPGALYDATWYGKVWRGADGISLMVTLPNGMPWCVDGPSRSNDGSRGNPWSRTGDPRNPKTLTCSPSIWSQQGKPNDYHGFLVQGWLEKC